MSSIGWINIKKTPEYKEAVREIEAMIAAKVRPLAADLAQAGHDIDALEKEIADLKKRLP